MEANRQIGSCVSGIFAYNSSGLRNWRKLRPERVEHSGGKIIAANSDSDLESNVGESSLPPL